MKVIFEWMSPLHKAKRILHNEKIRHNTKHGKIFIHKNTIDIVVYFRGTMSKVTIPNDGLKSSYYEEVE